MLSVDDALSEILNRTAPLEGDIEALTSSLLGHVLAESVVSDLDSPPHDKAMMDGYAVRAEDCRRLPITLTVIEEIAAGATPSKELGRNQAARIMTGAPIPPGADVVVMKERTEASDDKQVTLTGDPPKLGQHILRQGTEMKKNDIVLEMGTVLRPPEFGVLASVGRTSVKVYPFPRVSILSTGNELVEANMKPMAGQIRNSNGPMLVMQAVRAGGLPRYLGIARDDRDHLRSLITEGLDQSHLLILSGGVSMGSYDLVPEILAELGVVGHFHKVRLKPGKPLLFGTRGETLVFGLPGNPVSSFVCFELFVRSAIAQLRGLPEPMPAEVTLPLAREFRYSTDRPTYHPARVEVAERGYRVQPTPWLGSADLRALTQANALIVLPEGESVFDEGDYLPVLRFD